MSVANARTTNLPTLIAPGPAADIGMGATGSQRPAATGSSRMPGRQSPWEDERLDPAVRGEGRILVVDDDPAVRSTIVEILRMQGFIVDEAADGAAATWLIADCEFDVVLLDLRLCHVDGTAVLEGLEPTATVVIVSAFSCFEEEAIREQFGSMIFACLRKPVAPQQLIDVVRAAAAACHRPRVRPIAPRSALRLGLVGLASLGPPGS